MNQEQTTQLMRAVDELPPDGKQIINEFLNHQAKALAVMVERQKKYGPHNISTMGHNGVMVRMNDKFARLTNGLGDLGDESAADTHYDIANYALIGLMVHEGTWPKPPQKDPIAELLDQKSAIESKLAELGYYG